MPYTLGFCRRNKITRADFIRVACMRSLVDENSTSVCWQHLLCPYVALFLPSCLATILRLLQLVPRYQKHSVLKRISPTAVLSS
jgi:hypothetical protein